MILFGVQSARWRPPACARGRRPPSARRGAVGPSRRASAYGLACALRVPPGGQARPPVCDHNRASMARREEERLRERREDVQHDVGREVSQHGHLSTLCRRSSARRPCRSRRRGLLCRRTRKAPTGANRRSVVTEHVQDGQALRAAHETARATKAPGPTTTPPWPRSAPPAPRPRAATRAAMSTSRTSSAVAIRVSNGWSSPSTRSWRGAGARGAASATARRWFWIVRWRIPPVEHDATALAAERLALRVGVVTDERMPEHEPEREQVRLRPELLTKPRLGRAIARLTARAREQLRAGVGQHLGEAEVGELHGSVAPNEDVRRAHVAVRDGAAPGLALRLGLAVVEVDERVAQARAEVRGVAGIGRAHPVE